MGWEILAPLGTALVQNLAGWAQNSLQDGWQKYDTVKLGETVLRTVLLTLPLCFGLQMEITDAAWIGTLVNVGLTKVESIVDKISKKK